MLGQSAQGTEKHTIAAHAISLRRDALLDVKLTLQDIMGRILEGGKKP